MFHISFSVGSGSPPGKTMNSWLGNHDIMGMLPIPPKAVERGLAPPDLFPHKLSAKSQSSAMGYHTRSRLHTPQTSKIGTMNSNSMPPCFYGHALGDGRQAKTSIGTSRGDIYNVYVRWLSPPPVLSIGHMTIASGYDRVRRFVDSSLQNRP
jgi:hypothetical protein